jgi:hypothetical protein
MKYALIENNIVKQISYQEQENFIEVNDNVFADMIKKEDGTFDYSTEFKANQEKINTAIENRKNNLASGKQKLLDLGLTEEEVKALIGI